VIKNYLLKSKGIFSVALLFTIIIAVSPLASATIKLSGVSTVNYEIDDTLFANPERGFYKWSETLSIGVYDFLDVSEMQMFRTNYIDDDTGSNPITIISRNFYLENFLNSDVSSEYLANMQADFDAAREAGSKIKVRFSYFDTCAYPEYAALSPEPSRVFQHIQNLKDVLNANADVIMTVQLGFVGAWGEWWADDKFGPFPGNGGCQGTSADGITNQNWIDRRKVVEDMLDVLVDDRTVSIRNVKWKQGVFDRDTPITITEAFSGSDVARSGHFNDCFLSNPSNTGTYSSDPTIREQEKAFLEAETKYLPMGGETCGEYSPESYCSNAIAEMERMHWSYMNTDYDPDILSQWGECIDEIKKRLGYRLELNSGTYTDSVQLGSQFNINIDLKNVGFAAPFNPRDVELILRDQATNDEYTVKLPDDPRFWLADQSTTYSITRDICTSSSMLTGTYDMFLNLPDPYQSISDRPEYSIRLANTDSPNGATIWEASTGYNNLQNAISVTNSVPSPSCSSSLILSADGSFSPPDESAILTVVDGFDEKNSETLKKKGKTSVVQASDNDWWETEYGFYTSYELSNENIPTGSTIVSAVLYVEHFEEESFTNGALEWGIGTGWPNSPTVWGSTNPQIRQGEGNEFADSWDVTSFVDTPEKVNSMELLIKNNDNVNGKKTLVDHIYVEVTWSTGPPPPPNQSPIANAGPDQIVNEGDTVTFDGSTSYDTDGTITAYNWDFGDGSSASGSSATHVYTSQGTHTVTLTITDNSGLTDTDIALVIINNADGDNIGYWARELVAPLPIESTILTVVDGFDEKNSATLKEEGKTYVVQASDNDWWYTEFGFYTSYEFSDISLPIGATLIKVEIFVEHYEEEEFDSNKLDWMVGTLAHNPTIRAGESNEQEDSWDVTSLFENNPEQLNSLELMIINNDNISEKKTLMDNIYVIISWTA